MMIRHKIRVLVVDDSLVFRKALQIGLSADPGIEVVGAASDAFMARDMILELDPDVLTLDIEMPRMNGIDFLRRLMPQYPLPVVVVSSVSGRVFDALDAGAVDFVSKQERSIEALINELTVKIKIASTAQLAYKRDEHSGTFGDGKGKVTGKVKDTIIAIGASTGGTEAIYSIVKQFPANMPGVVIVQHMPPGFTRLYAARLNSTCAMEAREACTGDLVVPGTILVAPGDYQMRLRKVGEKYNVECYKGERVNGHSPSVDVLFESVAKKAGADAIGIILTGMGSDGAKGLLAMRQKGAITIGQSKESCVVYGMPRVAFEIGAIQKQASLMDIPRLLFSILNQKAQ